MSSRDFWMTEGVNHLRRLNQPSYYEGDDNVRHIERMVDGSVRDVACGYGRLCPLFSPKDYDGYDINIAAIDRGKLMHPEYRFHLWDGGVMPFAETTIIANTLLVVEPRDLMGILDAITFNTNVVVLSEIMDSDQGPETSVPFVCPRTFSFYHMAFGDRGFVTNRLIESIHEWSSLPMKIIKFKRQL